MSVVYVVEENSRTRSMKRVHCKNEDRELQSLLQHNPNLLPGEQIRPEDPVRWLLFKREMPVEDPSTGQDRWSVDFFLADQRGIPTFVECKRFLDTRSRREVIGQMFDYAANGHYYWTRSKLRDYASEEGVDLEEAVRALDPESGESVEDYLELVEANLREGQIRLIFFLEESPFELRSIVEFLNRQMERTEVLIVEAKQFEKDGFRVVAPSLFGYTEEARRIKKTVTISSGQKRQWDEDSFFEDCEARLGHTEVLALRKVLGCARRQGYEIKWGTGKTYGSFNLVLSEKSTALVLGFTTQGKMWFNFGGLYRNEEEEAFRDRLADLAREILDLEIPDDLSRYPGYQASDWTPQVEAVCRLIQDLSKE